MDDPTELERCPVNLGAGGSIVTFPSIELLATTEWSAPIEMEDRTVHVWGFSLDGNSSFLEQCRFWLNEDECVRATRFVRQQDHVRFVLAHGGLRAVLGRYLRIGPRDVELSRSETGKPFLANELQRQPMITFNMSHAHGRALIAVSKGQEVGVDLERIRPEVEVEKLSERYFASSEHASIMQLAEDQRAPRFFRYWVAKEAVLKAQGIGLQALHQCEILLRTEGVDAEVLVPEGSRLHSNWKVRLLSCDKGWEAAVAAQNLDRIAQRNLTGC
ncbi:MAG: 4'-phosphopantetheinyl transferase superfamily protein [Nitrospira sp.]|nr:4'-phosphopantetheinyl transferase superfamily protein [Nitrospira sp.]